MNNMDAQLFPCDGQWMLKVGTLGYYVDSKKAGIEMAESLAKTGVNITNLYVAE